MKINRRDFIKTGGMVMLGSLAVPSFLGSCTGNKVDHRYLIRSEPFWCQ